MALAAAVLGLSFGSAWAARAASSGPVMGQRCTKAQWGTVLAADGMVCGATAPGSYVWVAVPLRTFASSATTVVVAAGTTIPGDGDFFVGKQVQVGTYQSSGPKSGRTICGWFKKDALGEPIDSGVSRGSVILVVVAADKIVQTTGCEPFKKVS